MNTTVTIDRAYFETLLRRAQLHTSGRDFATPIDIPVVSIPKADHENLIQMAQEYTSLRQSLCNAGIEQTTLETLIRGELNQFQPSNDWGDNQSPGFSTSKIFSPPTKAHITISGGPAEITNRPSHRWTTANYRGGTSTNAAKSHLFSRNDTSMQEETPMTPEFEKDDHFGSFSKPERPQYERSEQRTILAKNLSERTTHTDIVGFVRGGALLDLYLRNSDKCASISFVEGDTAQEFMSYVRRNDIYIHGKRIEFTWNDRQFIMPKHVAYKIGVGATRNLIIRNVTAEITENRLREELDHIHNLVVVYISCSDGDIRLSLNSVHNALFARSCLMSRAAYKGLRIDWYPDECAQPLPKTQKQQKVENSPAASKKKPQPVNRFQMLINTDGTEDGSDNDGVDDTTLTELSSLHVSHAEGTWTSRALAT